LWPSIPPALFCHQSVAGTGEPAGDFHATDDRSLTMSDNPLHDADAYLEDDLDEADIVEWYEARPVTVSTAVATGSIVAAFAIGVLTAVGALALLGYMDED
jgi:hypothetical protein